MTQAGSCPFDVVPEFAFCGVDKSDGNVDPVEGIELGCGWRNWSNVSLEGSLNFLPDSRKSVRQFNRLIGVAPVFTKAKIDQGDQFLATDAEYNAPALIRTRHAGQREDGRGNSGGN